MGTNYYTKTTERPTCSHKSEGIHLGKSSGGWTFSFQYNGGQYYKNIEEMKEWLANKQIVNEYGEDITHEEFWGMVAHKQEEKLNHTVECRGKYGAEYDKQLYLIDGYSFSDGYFS